MSDVNVNIKAGQQVGLAQQSAISLSDQKKVAGSREDSSTSAPEQDSVDFGRVSREAGLQTGIMQNMVMQKAKGAKGAPAAEGKTPAEPAPAKPTQDQVPPSQGAPPQSPPPPGTGGTPDPAAGGTEPVGASATDAANRAKAYQEDVNNAMSVWWQMKADQAKWWANVWKIMQDTQTEIFKIWQEAYANRQAMWNKVHDMWSKLIRGDDPF